MAELLLHSKCLVTKTQFCKIITLVKKRNKKEKLYKNIILPKNTCNKFHKMNKKYIFYLENI